MLEQEQTRHQNAKDSFGLQNHRKAFPAEKGQERRPHFLPIEAGKIRQGKIGAPPKDYTKSNCQQEQTTGGRE